METLTTSTQTKTKKSDAVQTVVGAILVIAIYMGLLFMIFGNPGPKIEVNGSKYNVVSDVQVASIEEQADGSTIIIPVSPDNYFIKLSGGASLQIGDTVTVGCTQHPFLGYSCTVIDDPLNS